MVEYNIKPIQTPKAKHVLYTDDYSNKKTHLQNTYKIQRYYFCTEIHIIHRETMLLIR